MTVIGKRELTKEEIEAAKAAMAKRRAHPKSKVASQSFVDRMTSASADPDAPDKSGEPDKGGKTG